MGEVLNLQTFRNDPLFKRESARLNFDAAADPFPSALSLDNYLETQDRDANCSPVACVAQIIGFDYAGVDYGGALYRITFLTHGLLPGAGTTSRFSCVMNAESIPKDIDPKAGVLVLLRGTMGTDETFALSQISPYTQPDHDPSGAANVVRLERKDEAGSPPCDV